MHGIMGMVLVLIFACSKHGLFYLIIGMLVLKDSEFMF